MDILAEIRYRKIRQIGVGRGLNSEVFLAEDPHLKREVVVKEIDRTKIHDWDEYHREAQVMFAARHANVVPIHYACLTPTHVALAMPFYANGSLHDRILKEPVGLSVGFRIAQGVLTALSQVHTTGFLHFDLKPSNVLFSHLNEPMIADFGQARLLGPTGVAAVPPLYPAGIPPEFFTHGVGTVETDIYHAGLTFYRMFNGDPFFQNQKSRVTDLKKVVLSGRFPRRDLFLPHVPPGLRRVIRRALQVDPVDRYHTAVEMQDALSRIEIGTDWEPEISASGDMRWTGRRPSRATLVVDLFQESDPNKWSVQVHTDNGTRRKRGEGEFWATRLTYLQALNHLKGVFEGLA